MTKSKLLMAAAASCLMTTAASAAGPTYNWSGFYVGAQGGYLWGKSNYTAFSNGAPADTASINGLIAGGHLGFSHQTANDWVFGVEGDGEWSSADGSYENFTGIGSAGFSELDWQASARGKVGFAAGNWLASLTGGAAFGRFTYLGGPSLPVTNGFTSTEIGWTVGGGLDYVFPASNIYAGVEYRYTDYGAVSGELLPMGGVFIDANSTSHAVRGRLGVRF